MEKNKKQSNPLELLKSQLPKWDFSWYKQETGPKFKKET